MMRTVIVGGGMVGLTVARLLGMGEPDPVVLERMPAGAYVPRPFMLGFQGFVPLAEMFGYINFLRSATSGRGTFTMEFDHYAEVPASLVEKLMEKEK